MPNLHLNPEHIALALALARARGWTIPDGAQGTTLEELFGARWRDASVAERVAFLEEVDAVATDPARFRALTQESVAAPVSLSGAGGLAATVRPAGGARNPDPVDPSTSPGQGRYEVVKEHARGGMGRILIAMDKEVGREVALKELLSSRGAGLGWERERFLREARITGQLEHPNIVPVYEIGAGDDGGAAWYSMKLVRGETMEARILRIQKDLKLSAKQRLAERLKLLDAFIDACNAVAYAHSRGVVNRDLKPANIMIGDFGETLVLDWGLARKMGDEPVDHGSWVPKTLEAAPAVPAPGGNFRSGDTTRLTMDGDIVGTPSYMPPEQARGEIESVDEKSDVYSLGAMLYEIVTGRAPFEGGSLPELLFQVVDDEPPDACALEPLAPPELAAVARAAMVKDRARRLGSAKVLADEVRAWRDGRPMALYRHSTLEQLRRFARHNRALSVAIAASLTILVAGAVISLAYARLASDRASSERRAAASEHQARELADKRATEARVANTQAQAALVQAQGQRLAAYSLNLLEENTTGALLVAIESAKRAPGKASTTALWTSLSRLVERRRFIGHSHSILDGSFSPDGTRCVTAGADFVARIWDISTGIEVRRLEGHRGALGVADWSADGALILTIPDHPLSMRARPFQPEGTLDVEPRIWDARTGELVQVLKGHRAGLLGGGWLPDGRVLTWSEDCTARVWNLDGTHVVYGCPSYMSRVEVSPDRRWVAALSEDRGWLWNAGDPEHPREFSGHAGQFIHGVVFTPDSRGLLTCGKEGSVLLRDVETLQETRRLRPSATLPGGSRVEPKTIHACMLTRKGTLLVHGDSELYLLSPDLQAEPRVIPFGDGRLDFRFVSRDEGRIAMFRGAEAWVRDLATGRDSVHLRGHEYMLEFARISADGLRVLTGGRDQMAILWDTTPGACLPRYRWHVGRPGQRVSRDGTRALGLNDGRLEVHDNATGELLHGWDVDPGIYHCEFAPEGERVLALQTGVEVALVFTPGRPHPIRAETDGTVLRGRWFSRNGDWMTILDHAGQVRLWDLRSGTGGELRKIGTPYRIATSGDGMQQACVFASDAAIVLLRTSDGQELRRLTGHSGWTIDAGFGRDGVVYSSAVDATIRSWDPLTGAARHTGRWPLLEETDVIVSPDEATVGLTTERTARFYRADTLEEFAELPRHLPGLGGFSRDGKFATVHTAEGVVHLPLDPLPFAEAVVPRELTPLENERMSDSRAEAEAYSQAYYARHPRPTTCFIKARRALQAGKPDEALELAVIGIALQAWHPEGHALAASVHASRAAQLAEGSAERAAAVEAGLEALESAVERGYRDVTALEQDETLGPLRSHARWMGLLARARKLPWE